MVSFTFDAVRFLLIYRYLQNNTGSSVEFACCPSHKSQAFSRAPTVETDNAESPRMVYDNPIRGLSRICYMYTTNHDRV